MSEFQDKGTAGTEHRRSLGKIGRSLRCQSGESDLFCPEGEREPLRVLCRRVTGSKLSFRKITLECNVICNELCNNNVA